MRIFLHSYFILLLFSVSISAQVWVEGYCFLENQVDHSGTQVIFDAVSPTAVSDTVYTSNQGSYQVEISAGIYDILFKHDGYFEDTYSGHNLFSPIIVEDLTLLKKYDGIHLSGPLNGFLVDTVYIVDNNISVSSKDSLIIEAGAVFYFNTGTSLNNFGTLKAVGLEQDTIYFKKNRISSLWQGIRSDSSGLLVMNYCLIENSAKGLSLTSFNNSSIQNSTIQNNNWGISAGSNLDYLQKIERCAIVNNTDTGISCYSNVLVSNCTIYGNNEGLALDNNNTVINTIVSNNITGINIYSADNIITYCNFTNNHYDVNGVIPPYLGNLLTVNANSDSCDAYFNIFKDPLFVDPDNGDFHLQRYSPAIDAGDPTSPYDPDTTITDMGAFYFHQGPHPEISVDYTNIDYQTTFVNTDSLAHVTITNNGDLDLIIYDIKIDSTGFTHNWDVADTIVAPLSNLVLDVTFSPAEYRDYSGTLTIFSNDRNRHVGLSGIGVPPEGAFPTSLIVTGGGNDTTNWNYYINNTNPSTNDAYNKLSYGRYYGDTRLYYMNPESFQDLNGDTINDGIVDGDSLSPETFHQALLDLYDSDNPDFPNILFLAGHGHVDEFDINGDAADNIEIDTLAHWIDEANLEVSTPLVIIFEACFSGGYISKLAAPNRVIISACDADQFADYLDGESFSTHFWYEIWYGNDLWTSFNIASAWSYAHLNEQLPLLDADGNGIPNEATDQEIASNIFLGGRYMHGALLPEIVEVPSEAEVIDSRISLSVTCNGKMDKVWFRVYPEPYSGSPIVSELPYMEMTYSGDGQYNAAYDDEGFIEQDGDYVVRVEAVDDIFNYAVPRIIPVIVITTGIEDEKLPLSYKLNQNYPNPFNPTTVVSYQLPVASKVELTIYNLLGQKVLQKQYDNQTAGQHEITVDLSNHASGIYFFRLEAGGFVQTKKMVLLK